MGITAHLLPSLASGRRYSSIELNQTRRDRPVTSNPLKQAQQGGDQPGFPNRYMKDYLPF